MSQEVNPYGLANHDDFMRRLEELNSRVEALKNGQYDRSATRRVTNEVNTLLTEFRERFKNVQDYAARNGEETISTDEDGKKRFSQVSEGVKQASDETTLLSSMINGIAVVIKGHQSSDRASQAIHNENADTYDAVIKDVNNYWGQEKEKIKAAYKRLHPKSADAGLDTGDPVADAGGPESAPATDFAAAGVEVTGQQDPAEVAGVPVIRRPAAAPDAAPA